MYFHVFKIKCITNLHVGSGDINYNIVDKEVEKDPITNLPMIHASGIKGALLKYFQNQKMDEKMRADIFGAPGKGDVSKPGSYRFLDAHLLARPMRTDSGAMSCINVTTAEIMQNFLETLNDFGGKTEGKTVPVINFKDSEFLATVDVGVEGLVTGTLTEEQKKETAWMKPLIGKDFAFVRNLREFDLPIIARNYLENGISQNLWYEEFVPHGSVFYMMILTPEKDCALDFSQPIQIGGNASVGYGFCKIEEIHLSAL